MDLESLKKNVEESSWFIATSKKCGFLMNCEP
jgi:hypothetical protein